MQSSMNMKLRAALHRPRCESRETGTSLLRSPCGRSQRGPFPFHQSMSQWTVDVVIASDTAAQTGFFFKMATQSLAEELLPNRIPLREERNTHRLLSALADLGTPASLHCKHRRMRSRRVSAPQRPRSNEHVRTGKHIENA